MNEWAWSVLLLTAAANPPRQAGRTGRGLLGAAAVVVTATVLAWLSEPILDDLDVSLPSAWIGVGIVTGVAGVRDLLTVRPPAWEPALLRPEVLLPAVTIGADHGTAVAVAAAAVAAVLTAVVGRAAPDGRGEERATRGSAAAARLLGGLLAVLSADMIVDGILDV